MEQQIDKREWISALMDGQVDGSRLGSAVEAAWADAEGRDAWCAYHLIGETLRAGAPAVVAGSQEAFLAKMRLRLQEEAVVAVPVAAQPAAVVAPSDGHAANDWLWKLVAGVASVAAVGAVAWNVWAPGAGALTQPQPQQMAATPAVTVPVAADARGTVTMIRDPRLDQLLAAHRQLGGAGALQTPSGFLRNATFEGTAR